MLLYTGLHLLRTKSIREKKTSFGYLAQLTSLRAHETQQMGLGTPSLGITPVPLHLVPCSALISIAGSQIP